MQDTELKEKREVYAKIRHAHAQSEQLNFKKNSTRSIIQKQKSNTQLQPTSSTTENSTAANIVDAIRILAFH